jgi:hypothetical protein
MHFGNILLAPYTQSIDRESIAIYLRTSTPAWVVDRRGYMSVKGTGSMNVNCN